MSQHQSIVRLRASVWLDVGCRLTIGNVLDANRFSRGLNFMAGLDPTVRVGPALIASLAIKSEIKNGTLRITNTLKSDSVNTSEEILLGVQARHGGLLANDHTLLILVANYA